MSAVLSRTGYVAAAMFLAFCWFTAARVVLTELARTPVRVIGGHGAFQ